MTMTHPGLPNEWIIAVFIIMLFLALRIVYVPAYQNDITIGKSHSGLPYRGPVARFLLKSPWLLVSLKIAMVFLFLLVIAAGLFGTPIAERNIATVLTWNIWWTGLIISVFFIGTAWCAVCPWDSLATWLVRRRLWKRAQPNNSLNLRVPRWLRSVWPALVLFIALTWLELGFGVTTNPYLTALLSLLMVIMATVSLAIYENKAFCRYFCPVGRTIGFYSELAPVELRPIDTDVCARCTTLDCYHGTDTVEPCPTHLVMGRLKQNTYCTSCGNCTRSCPVNNISWRLRSPSREAIQDARPHWDEAWFMLGLLALTEFHGVSMLPSFNQQLSSLALAIGDSGRLLWSFSILLFLTLIFTATIYMIFVGLTRWLSKSGLEYRKLISGFAFIALPMAFSYHLAHNISHLVRESDGLNSLLANPFGFGAQPLSTMELHMRHMDILIPQVALYTIQAGLILFGFWISLKVIQYRGEALIPKAGLKLLPMVLFVLIVTGFHLWLLNQPMIMRM